MITYITASSIQKFLACQRAYYYRYELGLLPIQTTEALSFGRAYHACLEAKNNGATLEDSLKAGLVLLADDEFQQATLIGLFSGYFNRYPEETVKIQPETKFVQKIKGINGFRSAGVIDGLARKSENEWQLRESKTTGASVAPDSEYWDRLRFNIQLMNYADALKNTGYNVGETIYDVTRKPSIRPKQGETAEQYAERLKMDTLERPDFYFARRTVTILEDDLEAFIKMRYEMCLQIRFLRSRSKVNVPEVPWVRNCTQTACQSCEFKSFCLAGGVARPNEIPTGFEVGEKHPELKL